MPGMNPGKKTIATSGVALILLSGSLTPQSLSQKDLYIKGADRPVPKKVQKEIKAQQAKGPQIPENRERFLREIQKQLWKKGHLATSLEKLDTGRSKKDKDTAFWFIGPKYKWGHLSKGNVPKSVLSRSTIPFDITRSEPVSPERLGKLYEALIAHFENRGYPFASIQLDSISFEKNSISGALELRKGPYITFDTLKVKGDIDIDRTYLQRYLDIRPGQPYSEKKVHRIEKSLRNLSFLDIKKQTEVLFRKDKAVVFLYPEEKAADRFDGIIGFQQKKGSGDLLITGNVELGLRNSLGKGERIQLKWERLESQTQDLFLHYDHPFLFRSPVGTTFKFKLYKQDTTFSETDLKVGLNYFLKRDDRFQLFIKRKNSNLLVRDPRSLEGKQNFADMSTLLYGVGIEQQALDRSFNPSQGYRIQVHGALGNKEIRKGETGGVTPSSRTFLQGDADARGAFFLPLFQRNVLKLGGRAAILESEEILSNELYRIGGLNSLRGFPEQSLTASFYSIGNVEFRFLLGEKSNIFAFFDGGYYEDESGAVLETDTPFGFGAGTRFQTPAGVFSLSYGLGRQKGNPIEIRSGRVHFGFVNFF